MKAELTKEQKAERRAARKAERLAKEAAERETAERKTAEEFACNAANWNERLVNAMLDFAAFSNDGFSFRRLREGVNFVFPTNWGGDESFVNLVPKQGFDLENLSAVENALQQQRERLAEEERKRQLRATALAKLTDEERAALGLR